MKAICQSILRDPQLPDSILFHFQINLQPSLMILVSSTNPVKIQAAASAFELAFPSNDLKLKGISVPSGVADQPMSEEETRAGAWNRVKAARERMPEASWWVGIEGGIRQVNDGMEAFAWVLVANRDREGWGRSAGFFLPPEVARLVAGGMELGHADDLVFGTSNSKQANGAIGLLTHNLITRESLYVPAVLMALIPFLRPELYPLSANETTAGALTPPQTQRPPADPAGSQ